MIFKFFFFLKIFFFFLSKIERIKNSIDLISKDFKSGKWEEMKEEAIKLRYWTNIQNTLKEWNPKKK